MCPRSASKTWSGNFSEYTGTASAAWHAVQLVFAAHVCHTAPWLMHNYIPVVPSACHLDDIATPLVHVQCDCAITVINLSSGVRCVLVTLSFSTVCSWTPLTACARPKQLTACALPKQLTACARPKQSVSQHDCRLQPHWITNSVHVCRWVTRWGTSCTCHPVWGLSSGHLWQSAARVQV